MEQFIESTDFTKIKLDIYEKFDNNEITELEKDTLLESIAYREIEEAVSEKEKMTTMVSMSKVASIAAASVVAGVSLSVLGAKVVSMIKIEGKIKASDELSKINNDIKKCSDKLKKIKSDIQKLINTYKEDAKDAAVRANFYGNRTTTSLVSNGLGGINIQSKYNPMYDKQKSEEEKQKSIKLKETVSEYIEKRQELNLQIKELKSLKSRFMQIVKSNLGPEEVKAIGDQLNSFMETLEN